MNKHYFVDITSCKSATVHVEASNPKEAQLKVMKDYTDNLLEDEFTQENVAFQVEESGVFENENAE